tara:strand:- start:81 stop:1007 length:927 start_codon:yes stop_codon:yes gene_type:complete
MRRALAKSLGAVASPEFVMKIKTDLVGATPSDQFNLAIQNGPYDVNWGDGNIETLSGFQTHTYDVPGEYIVKVIGASRLYYPWNNNDSQKLQDILNWGQTTWTSIYIHQAYNLTKISASDIPSLSSCAFNVQAVFEELSIVGWDTTQLSVFSVANNHNLTNVYGLDDMYVTNKNNWFDGFKDNRSLNFDPSNWVFNTVDTGYSSQLDFYQMFRNCYAFDADLGNWDVSLLRRADGFLFGGGLSRANYDSTLVGWLQSLENVYPGGANYPFTININFGSSQYTLGGAAEAARNTLVNTFGWTITDGGGI